MNLSEFTYLLNNPNSVTSNQITELNSILKVYPYFQSARSLYLKGLQNHDSIKYNSSLKKTAAHTTDRTILFDFITSENFISNKKDFPKNKFEVGTENKTTELVNEEIQQEQLAENKLEQSLINSIEIASLEEKKGDEINELDLKNPLEQSIISSIKEAAVDEPEENNTEEIETQKTEMNSWLEDKIEDEEEKQPISFKNNETHSFQEWLQLSKLKPIEREEPKQEIIIEQNVIEEDKDLATKMDLIDKFIENNPKISPPKENSSTPSYIAKKEDTSYLMTETLAKIYLEQKKYSKAIQAYEILILKYPEKSSLFADRILDIKELQQNNNK